MRGRKPSLFRRNNMAIFRVTTDDVYEELQNAVKHHQSFIEVEKWDMADMWRDEINSIILYCEVNAEKLGLL